MWDYVYHIKEFSIIASIVLKKINNENNYFSYPRVVTDHPLENLKYRRIIKSCYHSLQLLQPRILKYILIRVCNK